MRHTVLLLLLAIPGAGQTLGCGVKGALPVDGFDQSEFQYRYGARQSYANRYQVGPFVEIRLPRRLAIEVDALYGREHLSGQQAPTGAVPFPFDALTARGASVHVAALARWRLLRGPIAPFVSAGPAMRWTHLDVDLHRTDLTPTAQTQTESLVTESHAVAGFAVGGGIEFRLGRLRIAPEARYTAYRAVPCGACLSLTGDFPSLSPVVLMLGIGF